MTRRATEKIAVLETCPPFLPASRDYETACITARAAGIVTLGLPAPNLPQISNSESLASIASAFYRSFDAYRQDINAWR
ncbi:MAG TPA: hypothetical protein VGJ81_22145 [Thermoanaerobaculia bacterium]